MIGCDEMKSVAIISIITIISITLMSGCTTPSENSPSQAADVEIEETESTVESEAEFTQLYNSENDDYKIDAFTSDLTTVNIAIAFKGNDRVDNSIKMKDLMTSSFVDFKDSYDRFSFIFSDSDGAISMFDFEKDGAEFKPIYVLWLNEDYKAEF